MLAVLFKIATNLGGLLLNHADCHYSDEGFEKLGPI